jgi:hypothetical protein
MVVISAEVLITLWTDPMQAEPQLCMQASAVCSLSNIASKCLQLDILPQHNTLWPASWHAHHCRWLEP